MAAAGSVRLTHVGGPTVLLEFGGLRILTDPTFDPPGRRYRFGFGSASTKTAGPTLSTAGIGDIDAVLLTHDHHADNLDDAGRTSLIGVPTVFTTRSGASRLRGNAVGMAPWDTTDVVSSDGEIVTITATPCRHGPPLSKPLVGDVIGFALTTRGRPGAVWFSGDTVLFRGVREVARRIDVDIAVLHVGAVRFPITGPVRYTMTIRDAEQLTELMRPRISIPVHYEGWSHFSQGEQAIRSALGDGTNALRAPFRLLERGVVADVSPVTEPGVAGR